MCLIMSTILEINFNRANEKKIDSATVKSYEIISNASASTRSSMVSTLNVEFYIFTQVHCQFVKIRHTSQKSAVIMQNVGEC